MRWKKLQFHNRFQRTVALALTLIMWFSLIGVAVCNSASAAKKTAEPAASLTVKAGYFGREYTTIKVFSLEELEAMPQVEQAYTFIDNMPAVVISSARGVKLTHLLKEAGIDIDSIQTLYFYTNDIKGGWYVSLPRSFLLDTRRYYYPNLPAEWNYSTETATPRAVYGAVEVEPIIAMEDYWKRFATSPDFTKMTNESAFRLLFGQTDTSTRTAMKSARWVNEISVMLVGTPPTEVVLDQDTINLPIGSAVKLMATVAPDDVTDNRVTWSSSDTSVAIVDEEGLVSVVGPGTAAITVTTVEGEKTATCIVNAVVQGDDEDETELAAASSPSQEEPGTPEPEKEQDTIEVEAVGQHLAEKEGAGAAKISGVSGLSGHIFEVSIDTVPLQLPGMDPRISIYAAIIFIFLFLSGAVKKYVEYTKEVAM